MLELDGWQTILLRLTAFPSAPINESVNWWENLIGSPPESRTSQPRSGQLHEEGQYEKGVLSLDLQPLRIDWILKASEPTLFESANIPTIGSVSQSFHSFMSLMSKWIKDSCPDLRRIAFGAILIIPVEDRSSAYKQLVPYLHKVELDTEQSSDFLYQINRPRSSKTVANLPINRLSKWGAMALGQSLAQIQPQPMQIVSVQNSEIYISRLELDVNTTSDFAGDLHREQTSVVFEELVELANEIAEQGDILQTMTTGTYNNVDLFRSVALHRGKSSATDQDSVKVSRSQHIKSSSTKPNEETQKVLAQEATPTEQPLSQEGINSTNATSLSATETTLADFIFLLNTHTDEDFEYGKTSRLVQESEAFINIFGENAIEVLAQVISKGLATDVVISEVLRHLGDYQHPATYNSRLVLLEYSLRHTSRWVRYGAALGLAAMKDKRAIPYLREAISQEKVFDLRDDLGHILAYLERN